MAFDNKRPYGQCIGGVLDGCVMQDDRFYRIDGTEVTIENEPIKPAKINGKKLGTEKEAPKDTPAVDPQVAEQLKGE